MLRALQSELPQHLRSDIDLSSKLATGDANDDKESDASDDDNSRHSEKALKQLIKTFYSNEENLSVFEDVFELIFRESYVTFRWNVVFGREVRVK